MGADASMLLAFKKAILQAGRNHDEVKGDETWQRLKTFVPDAPYCERDAEIAGIEVTTRVY